MASSSQKLLPVLMENGSYETWVKDIKIWCELTEMPKKKQALAIHLSLNGKARVASSELSIDELNKDGGVGVLLAKLDSVFLADISRRQFAAFNELYNFRRSASSEINSFITDFEHSYFAFKNCEMTLPDPVMALMLLAACKLGEREVQLVMSAVDEVSYDKMKSVLKRTFAKGIASEPDVLNPASMNIKTEPVFYGESDSGRRVTDRRQSSFQRGGRGKSTWTGRSSFQDFGERRERGDNSSTSRRTNPIGKDGLVSRCVICDSRFHWARNCPDAYENKREKEFTHRNGNEVNEVVQLSLFMGYSNEANVRNKLQTLVDESRNFAVLDTGCSSTVCGIAWLNRYLDSLSEMDVSNVVEANSPTTFTFADGVTVSSLKKVKLPCCIGTKRATIETDVVDCNIPLLLSKRSMKKAEMMLNFSDDSIIIGDEKISLRSASSGHYLMPLSF